MGDVRHNILCGVRGLTPCKSCSRSGAGALELEDPESNKEINIFAGCNIT